MAKENVPHGGKVLSSVYKAVAGGEPMSTVDLLINKLGHLQAMLLMTYGEAQDPFETLAAHVRDNYMWACSTLVEECIELVEKSTTGPEVAA